MKKKLILVLISLSLLMTVLGRANASGTRQHYQFDTIKKQIEQLVDNGKVPSMAVAVAHKGDIIWEEGFGFANRGNNIPASENTAYPLASISKPLTATGLMILEERGLVSLDSPINIYLGEAKLLARVGDASNATVRKVASHTAGLPLHSRHFYDNESYRLPQMDETIRRYGNIVSVPGKRFQYSNLGYGLIGHVISRVTGMSYADFMREEVFTPLGMKQTAVKIGSGQDNGQAVKYISDGSVIPHCDSDCPGAGSIYGSAHDLIRYAMFHLKNGLPDQRAIITNASIDKMQCPNPDTGPMRAWEKPGSGYGIGWRIGITEAGLRGVYHSGGIKGISNILALVPEENIAVAVLSNTDSRWPETILVSILNVLLPGKFPLPTIAAKNNSLFAPLPALIGLWKGFIYTYREKIPLVLEIDKSGDVHTTMGKLDRMPLETVSYQDQFPKFMNAGGGPYLRGWMLGSIETEDVNRGRPYKLWLELKPRGNALNGSVIAFSLRKNPTGPLTHWVDLKRR